MEKMYERIFTPFHQDEFLTLDLTGEAEPTACARVYYKPSLTSLAADFRKSIVPTNPDNHFLFFDLKAAEFFMFCYFAGEQEVIDAYNRGEDVYQSLSHHFPEGIPRKHYKTALIASLYGGTPYTTSKRLGISENHADRLHLAVAKALPKLEALKSKIKKEAKINGHYRYPTNWEQTEFTNVPYKVLPKTKQIGFSENLALSVYIQSALGYLIQKIIHKTESIRQVSGTFLTVFDSVLIETNSTEQSKLQDFFTQAVAPLRIGAFTTGKTFYEAYRAEEQL
jgi:hypothetical protein